MNALDFEVKIWKFKVAVGGIRYAGKALSALVNATEYLEKY